MAGAFVSGALSPYTNGRDPRSGCDSSGLPGQGLGYSAARGYQYSTGQGESLQGRKKNFDFGDFFQGMLTEGVTEGLSSAGSFGLGKVLDAIKRGIQGRKSRVAGGSRGISTNSKVDKIAKQAREWLGDDVRLVTNKNGDKIFMSCDSTKRLRFDINNTSPHNNPHGHVEEFIDGKWIKSGPIYPIDVPHN